MHRSSATTMPPHSSMSAGSRTFERAVPTSARRGPLKVSEADGKSDQAFWSSRFPFCGGRSIAANVSPSAEEPVILSPRAPLILESSSLLEL